MPETNGAGHNSRDDDKAALQLSFSAKIRAQLKEAAKFKAAYDAERTKVNGLFSQARGLLDMTRKDFEEVLAAQDMDEDEFLLAEAARTARFARQGLPVGTQLDMFPTARNDAADDQARAHANGLRAGRRGDEREMPGTISPVFMNDWLGGYDQGQAELQAAFVRHNEIEAAKDAKAPVLRDEPDEEEDDGEELTEAAIKAGAKKLKNSDFMKPTAAEQEFAPA
jgi:ribosome modulation factor